MAFFLQKPKIGLIYANQSIIIEKEERRVLCDALCIRVTFRLRANCWVHCSVWRLRSLRCHSYSSALSSAALVRAARRICASAKHRGTDGALELAYGLWE